MSVQNFPPRDTALTSIADRRSTLVRSAAPAKEPALKRPLDFVLASIGLVLSAPLWALVALAIKIEDGGPVFYMQKRWGRAERQFVVRKFRTMIPDADKRYGILQAREGDDRITRVGRFLRACGMDELPQLLSIWKGDMSFVGPRALAIGELVDDGMGNKRTYEHTPGFRERLVVRPGLTSIATIFIAKDSSPRRKFRYDMLYIRRQSFWLDIYLIALSFWISFRGKWETRGGKL
ncbi:MAG TPA: sugar transferase [Roseiflexaceae bacterium]|nr:sugar transferase [Roseiflexaceae bacterium]